MRALWLVNQQWLIVQVNSSKSRVYKSNRPQLFMVYKLINHAGCWKNTRRIRKLRFHVSASFSCWTLGLHMNNRFSASYCDSILLDFWYVVGGKILRMKPPRVLGLINFPFFPSSSRYFIFLTIEPTYLLPGCELPERISLHSCSIICSSKNSKRSS